MKNFLILLTALLIFFPSGLYIGLNAAQLGLTNQTETHENTNPVENLTSKDSPVIEGYNYDPANNLVIGGSSPVEISEEFLEYLSEKKAVINNFTFPYLEKSLADIYIAAAFLDEENESSYFTTEIYRYNLKTQDYTKVFEYFSSNEAAATQLRPIASENDLLIVQKEKVALEPTPCATVWTEGEIQAIDLTDNERSLVSYSPPEYISERNQIIIERCEFSI